MFKWSKSPASPWSLRPLLFNSLTPDSFLFIINASFVTDLSFLTHCGWVTHICVSELTIFGSDNGLSPSRRLAIIWSNGGILLIRNLGTNFSEILSEIYTFSFKKIHLKFSSRKWSPFCLGLNALIYLCATTGDFWIFPWFQIWMLHYGHISRVITNCDQRQWVLLSLFSSL